MRKSLHCPYFSHVASGWGHFKDWPVVQGPLEQTTSLKQRGLMALDLTVLIAGASLVEA